MKAEANALRLWLGAEAIRELRIRDAEASAEDEVRSKQLVAEEAQLSDLLLELSGLRASAGDAGVALERDTAAAARLETVVERLRRYALVARERRVAIEGRIEGAGERRDDLTAEREELVREVAEAAITELRLAGDVERRTAALEALEDEERTIAEQVQLPADGLVANLRGDLRALENAEERDRRELEAIVSRRRVVADRLDQETNEAVELNRAIQKADAAVTASQRGYDEARTLRVAAEDVWELVDREHSDVLLAVAAGEARIEAHEAAIAGIGDPAAHAMTERHDGVSGVVARALDATPEVADAVDRALGTWADAFLASDRDSIHRLTADLKGEGLGGVSLVSPAGTQGVPAREAAAELGLDALVDLLGPNADRAVADVNQETLVGNGRQYFFHDMVHVGIRIARELGRNGVGGKQGRSNGQPGVFA